MSERISEHGQQELVGTITDAANSTKNEILPVVFDEVLDIAVASALQASLLEAVAANRLLMLVGEKVERIDTAGLQVLCALVQLLRSRNQSIQWQNPSDQLRHSAALLGLEDYLGLTLH